MGDRSAKRNTDRVGVDGQRVKEGQMVEALFSFILGMLCGVTLMVVVAVLSSDRRD